MGTTKTVKITDAQLKAIINLRDDISAMIGCGDDDSQWVKNVNAVDRFLKANGYKSKYN